MADNKASYERKQKIKNYFYGLDTFGSPMITNFEGKEKFGSLHGICLSLIYYILIIAYLAKVTIRLVYRYNPEIAYTEVVNHFTYEDTFNLLQNDMNIAFAVTNYITNEPFDNSDFVEWEIYLERRENLLTTEKIVLETHSCSE